MKRVSKRIGKFEIRSTGNLKNDFEVLQWFPNKYYGKKDQYIKISSEHYRDPKFAYGSIHESCFESPENCMVIGYINVDSDMGWTFEEGTALKTKKVEDKNLDQLLLFFDKWIREFYEAIE